MADDSQREVHERIADSLAEEDDLEDGVLTNWVVIAECATPDGSRWISRLTSEDATTWQIEGMLHHALYSWMGDEDE